MTTDDLKGNQLEFLPITKRHMTDLRPHKDLGWAYERPRLDPMITVNQEFSLLIISRQKGTLL